MKTIFLFAALAAQASLTLAADQTPGTTAHEHMPGMDMSTPFAPGKTDKPTTKAPTGQNAEPMDHSKMNHGNKPMDMDMSKQHGGAM